MQKLTHFTVSKNWHNRIPVGRLGGIAPQLFCRGAIAPMESASTLQYACGDCRQHLYIPALPAHLLEYCRL